MWPVSQRFIDALHSSHTIAAECDIFSQRKMVADNVPILGGTISDDSQALIRRRGSFFFAASEDVLAMLDSDIPDDGGMWPTGNELHVRVGLRFPDNTQELVPNGVYRISKPVLTESNGQVSIAVDGYDRARAVSRARFTKAYTVSPSNTYPTAIRSIVSRALPWIPYSDYRFMASNYKPPLMVFTMDDDPMGKAQEMAQSIGAELYFDGDGRPTLRPEPDPVYDPPCFYYVEGQDATLTTLQRTLDDEQAYNGIIVTSENSQIPKPIRAEIWDTDVDSPTWYDPTRASLSKYGPVPFFMSSQYITTQAQANQAAQANLGRVLGVIESIQFNAVNNPAHESGDVIAVGRDRLSVRGTHILDSFQISFGNTVSFSGTTRKRRVSA